MRRAPLLLAMLLVAASPSFGSLKRDRLPIEKLPQWVQDAHARELDPGEAPALLLHDELIVKPQVGGRTHYESRIALRIYEDTALLDSGVFSLVYREGDVVLAFDGWTIQPGGEATLLERKEDIVDRPYTEAAVASDLRERVLAPPRVSVGSTVAVVFAVDLVIDGGGKSFLFGSEEWPSALSRLVLELPEGWKGDIHALRAEDLERDVSGGRISLTGRNLPAAPDVPLRLPVDQALPLAWAHWWNPAGHEGFASWAALGDWYRRQTDPVLADDEAAAALARAWSPEKGTPLDVAIREAATFVTRDVRYTAIETGLGGYVPRSPSFVATRRFGDCKDKAFLLRSMAESWGLATYPVLVLAGSSRPIHPDVPALSQFDHVIAAIALPEGIDDGAWNTVDLPGAGRLLLVDATDHDSSPWTLRPSYQGKDALVILDDDARLVRLPVARPEQSTLRSRASMGVGSSGRILEGLFRRIATGDYASAARASFDELDDEQRRRQASLHLQQVFPGCTMDDFELSALDDIAAPFREQASIKGGMVGKRAGGFLVLEPGRISRGLELGILPPPPSPSDLHLGSPRSVEAEASVELLLDWKPLSLPEDWSLETPELSASVTWIMEGRHLVYRFSASLKVLRLPGDRYAAFRDAALEIEKRRLEGVLLSPSGGA